VTNAHQKTDNTHLMENISQAINILKEVKRSLVLSESSPANINRSRDCQTKIDQVIGYLEKNKKMENELNSINSTVDRLLEEYKDIPK
jgi:hypothetical protein